MWDISQGWSISKYFCLRFSTSYEFHMVTHRINQCKHQILLSVPGNDFKNIVYLIKKIRKTNK